MGASKKASFEAHDSMAARKAPPLSLKPAHIDFVTCMQRTNGTNGGLTRLQMNLEPEN